MTPNTPFALHAPFIPSPQPGKGNKPLYFLFQGDNIVVEKGETEQIHLPVYPPPANETLYSQCFGQYNGQDCFVVELNNSTSLPETTLAVSLRALAGRLKSDLFTLAGRGLQILHWHYEHQFCGRCGKQTTQRKTELAKICPKCDLISYPTISPAVIMAVTKGREILLGRAARFPEKMYSTLAGFVEPGETLEEAVCREVREETNITVTKVRYLASQPWPFPHSLMIGFTAEYQEGELKIDHSELEDARWFSMDNLPKLPSRITIARLLIDSVVENMR